MVIIGKTQQRQFQADVSLAMNLFKDANNVSLNNDVFNVLMD